MITNISLCKCFLFIFFMSMIANVSAETPAFKSHLFKKGTLVYSDDFDGKFDRDRWEPRTQTRWEVKDGLLIGRPSSKEFQEAQKAKGDSHLGLGPVIRLNHIPEKFVCHMRFKFEGETYQAARPLLDIGHHINSIVFKKGGYSLKLSEKKRFNNIEADFEINKWTDMVIEFKEGTLLIEINGQRNLFEHEQVSLKSRDEFTFKALHSPNSRLLFDHVRLWEVE